MVKSPHNDPDEIDPLIVLERIFSFFFRYRFLLIISACIGILGGFGLHKTVPKSYGSTLILHSQVLSNPEEIQIIENWNILIRNGEYSVLSRDLNCSIADLKKIRYLSAENMQVTTPASGFIIQVVVADTSILNTLQESIIYGLENTAFVKERVDFKRNGTIQIIEAIKEEIAKLDSTKRRIESATSPKTAGSPSFIVNISDLNTQTILLREKLYSNEENLRFIGAIQVLQNFEKYRQPSSPRLLNMMLSGLLGGLFIGFIIALTKSLRPKLERIRRERQQPANT